MLFAMQQNRLLYVAIHANANWTVESRILQPRQGFRRKVGQKVLENTWLFVYMEAHKSYTTMSHTHATLNWDSIYIICVMQI